MSPVKKMMRKNLSRHTWVDRERPHLIHNKNLNANIPYDEYIVSRSQSLLSNINPCRLPNEMALYDSICDYYNLNINNVSIGFGATELLERLFRLYKNHKIYIHEPSYEMARVMCDYMDITNTSLHSLQYKYDIKAFGYFKDKNSILYIANPNGNNGSVYDLLPLLDNFKYVIVDEVYADFIEEPSYRLFADNVIVLKSFSKSLGLAGLRCGFAIANEEITKQLQEIRPVFVCNTAAELIIPELIKETRNVNDRWKESKEYFEKYFEHTKSHGPYMLFKKPNYFTNKFGYKLTHDNHYRMALADPKTLGL